MRRRRPARAPRRSGRTLTTCDASTRRLGNHRSQGSTAVQRHGAGGVSMGLLRAYRPHAGSHCQRPPDGVVTAPPMARVATLFVDAGGFGSRGVREAQRIFQALEKEGLEGGAHDTSRVVRHRHSHDPGLQQAPQCLASVLSIARFLPCLSLIHLIPRHAPVAMYGGWEYNTPVAMYCSHTLCIVDINQRKHPPRVSVRRTAGRAGRRAGIRPQPRHRRRSAVLLLSW